MSNHTREFAPGEAADFLRSAPSFVTPQTAPRAQLQSVNPNAPAKGVPRALEKSLASAFFEGTEKDAERTSNDGSTSSIGSDADLFATDDDLDEESSKAYTDLHHITQAMTDPVGEGFAKLRTLLRQIDFPAVPHKVMQAAYDGRTVDVEAWLHEDGNGMNSYYTPGSDDREGVTLLMAAAFHGREALVRGLLRGGAWIEQPSRVPQNNGLGIISTPLIAAASEGQLGTVSALLEHAEAAEKDDVKDGMLCRKHEFGETAVYVAAVAGHYQTVAHLLRAGAPPDTADDAGKLPSQAARDVGYHEVAQLLQKYQRLKAVRALKAGQAPRSEPAEQQRQRGGESEPDQQAKAEAAEKVARELMMEEEKGKEAERLKQQAKVEAAKAKKAKKKAAAAGEASEPAGGGGGGGDGANALELALAGMAGGGEGGGSAAAAAAAAPAAAQSLSAEDAALRAAVAGGDLHNLLDALAQHRHGASAEVLTEALQRRDSLKERARKEQQKMRRAEAVAAEAVATAAAIARTMLGAAPRALDRALKQAAGLSEKRREYESTPDDPLKAEVYRATAQAIEEMERVMVDGMARQAQLEEQERVQAGGAPTPTTPDAPIAPAAAPAATTARDADDAACVACAGDAADEPPSPVGSVGSADGGGGSSSAGAGGSGGERQVSILARATELSLGLQASAVEFVPKVPAPESVPAVHGTPLVYSSAQQPQQQQPPPPPMHQQQQQLPPMHQQPPQPPPMHQQPPSPPQQHFEQHGIDYGHSVHRANPKAKTSLCKHFMAGGCRLGSGCLFAHGVAELSGGKNSAERGLPQDLRHGQLSPQPQPPPPQPPMHGAAGGMGMGMGGGGGGGGVPSMNGSAKTADLKDAMLFLRRRAEQAEAQAAAEAQKVANEARLRQAAEEHAEAASTQCGAAVELARQAQRAAEGRASEAEARMQLQLEQAKADALKSAVEGEEATAALRRQLAAAREQAAIAAREAAACRGDDAALGGMELVDIEKLVLDAPRALMRMQQHVNKRMAAQRRRDEEQHQRSTECSICMAAPKGVVFVPCGHVLACVDCAQTLDECPSCRACIKQKVRMYSA